MNKTQLLAEALDSQLSILNIEGLYSEHEVIEYMETETEITECPKCKGKGEIEDLVLIDDYSDGFLRDLLEYDFDDHGRIYSVELVECPECDGFGGKMVDHEVPYQDSWFTSNIII